MDRGYDYDDVHQFVEQARYIAHIKHRCRRGEPPLEDWPVPGETQFPARRWVVERTFGWLAKRRSLRVRWCKKVGNWLAFVQFACAHILMDMAIYVNLSVFVSNFWNQYTSMNNDETYALAADV